MSRIAINLYILFSALVMITGCKKWVDVSPRTEVREEDFFNNEMAFREAINGVYYTMGSKAMYGREMTWGMVDVLGGIYSIDNLSSTNYPEYIAVHSRNFASAAVEPKITAMWTGSYQCIANINNLIKNLEKADPSLFSSAQNREILLGEALGLRAFLHFDLLKLFAPLPGAQGSDQPVIPYVETYSTDVKPLVSVAEATKKVLDDLSRAEQLMSADPIIHAEVATTAGLTSRKVKFNYYAVKALQARVHLWTGNKEQALLAAQVVLDAAPTRFPWIDIARVSVGWQSRDRILSTELIFGLVVDNIVDYTVGVVNNVFEPAYGETNSNLYRLSISAEKREEVFETTTVGLTDLRNLYLVEVEESSTEGSAIIYSKLKTSLYGTDTLGYRMPMFRISEMHYIAAECLAESQPEEAIKLLNEVRAHRGIGTSLPSGLSLSELQTEIRKEYMKEFPLEGQVFSYRKRKGEVNDVLPLPLGETEYR